MNKRKLAENAKAVTNTAGKYTLKGLRLAGLGFLSATDIASRGVNKIARNPSARKLASKAAIIAACVAFPTVAATIATAGITATAINYMYHNCIEGEKTSALESADNVIRMSDKVLEKTLSVVAMPTKLITREISEAAQKGKTSIKKAMRNDAEAEPEI